MIAPQRQSTLGLAVSAAGLFCLLLVAVLIQTLVINPVLQRDDAALSTGLALQQRLLYDSDTAEASIKSDALRFAQTLRDGGQFLALNGQPLLLPASSSEQLRASVDVLTLLSENGDGSQFSEAFTSVKHYFRGVVETHRQRALWFQSTVLVNAVLLLAFIFSQFLGRLRRANLLWNATMLENKTILEATNDGLFLIKPSLQVGSVQSRAVQRIFGLSQPISGNFFEFLKRLVSAEDLDQAREYILLMLKGQGKADLLHNLNPLSEVEITVENAVGLVARRFVSFDFARNELNPGAGLLVSVRDITKEVELKHELLAAGRENDSRFSLVIASLGGDAKELAQFCQDSQESMQHMVASLRERTQADHEQESALRATVLQVQALKNRAGDVGISLVETSALALETQIQRLLTESMTDHTHINGVIDQLEHIISELTFLEQLSTRLGHEPLVSEPVLSAVAQSSASKESALDEFEQYVKSLAERHGKRVGVERIGFNQYEIGQASRDYLDAICLRLVSNAILHGIEVPEVRRQREKASEGRVLIALRDLDADNVVLTIKDDGAGFDFDAIRKTVVKRKLATAESAHEMSKDELVRYIFVAGFSTRAGASQSIGKGMGLDFVKQTIAQLGGKISVKSSRGVSAKIVIRLPKSSLRLDHAPTEVVLEQRVEAV